MEKVVVLTPAIATFERLVSEMKMLEDGTHPELLDIRRKNEETLKERFSALDKTVEYEKGIIARQCQCEIQSAQDELEDFNASLVCKQT